MIYIDDESFYEKPGMCCDCPFFDGGGPSTAYGSDVGFCRMFEESHKRWINPPRRCQKLFNKAFRMPEGRKLVVVSDD